MSFIETLLRIDPLAKFVAIFVCVFTVLTIVYSLEHMRKRGGLVRYYIYVVVTGLVSVAAVLSNNLVLFMVFWGFLGLLLYVLINFGQTDRTSLTAKKSFIIIGGTDAFMLLGLALLFQATHYVELSRFLTLKMAALRVPLDSRSAIIAYLCLAAGALAKAGAMPFHTWVPDTAEDAPTPVTAFLPASLDKLLGVYFLVRLSRDVFVMNNEMNTLLMALGSVTIVGAVMMALVQRDMKRMLGYDSVSQVGYMMLGIGTGTDLGLAAALFHMFNYTLYKSCLFFAGGAVEQRAGTSDLDRLGGLCKAMPITFMTFLIAALAISGVPPLNGFYSKWMLYQAVIAMGAGGGFPLWIIWLLAAMFGSALTLAVFMKLTHSVFLGQRSEGGEGSREVGAAMWLPSVLLAAACVVFGVAAYRLPLPHIICPSLNTGIEQLGLTGAWRPADFYDTVEQTAGLSTMYRMAEARLFDVYEVGRNFTLGLSKVLSFLHNGVLPRYLAWCLLGVVVLLYALIRWQTW